MRLDDSRDPLQSVQEVLAGELRISGQTTIIIGIEDAAAALHEKAVDGAIEKVLRRAFRLHHDRETVDLTDLVVLAFGARFLRDLLQARGHGLDVCTVRHTFYRQLIDRHTVGVTL